MNALCAKTSSRDPEECKSMPTISLKVMHLPSGAADPPMPGLDKPLFRGTGDTDYVCGNCGSVIAASMGSGQRVIVDSTNCPACGAENEFPLHLRA
jgi:hypothetical protein